MASARPATRIREAGHTKVQLKRRSKDHVNAENQNCSGAAGLAGTEPLKPAEASAIAWSRVSSTPARARVHRSTSVLGQGAGAEASAVASASASRSVAVRAPTATWRWTSSTWSSTPRSGAVRWKQRSRRRSRMMRRSRRPCGRCWHPCPRLQLPPPGSRNAPGRYGPLRTDWLSRAPSSATRSRLQFST